MPVAARKGDFIPHFFGSKGFLLEKATQEPLSLSQLATDISAVIPTAVVKRLGRVISGSMISLSDSQPPSGQIEFKILDTRIVAALTETLLRHPFINTSCGKITLPPNPKSSLGESLTLDNMIGCRNRMNMDADLFAVTVEGVAKRKSLEGNLLYGSTTATVRSVVQYIVSDVTAGGVYSDDGSATNFICAVWLLHTVDVAKDEIHSLLRHDNRYVKMVALVYLRYVIAPEEIWDFWARSQAIADLTVVSFTQDGETGSVAELSRRLLFDDEVFEAWFPTYDKSMIAELKKRVEDFDDQVKNGKIQLKEGEHNSISHSEKRMMSSSRLGFGSLAEMAKSLEIATRMAQRGAQFEETMDESRTLGVDNQAAERARVRRKRARDADAVAMLSGEFKVVPDSVYFEF